jgi:hypothetical protein
VIRVGDKLGNSCGRNSCLLRSVVKSVFFRVKQCIPKVH